MPYGHPLPYLMYIGIIIIMTPNISCGPTSLKLLPPVPALVIYTLLSFRIVSVCTSRISTNSSVPAPIKFAILPLRYNFYKILS